ncbi:MAG: hypothetical protein Q8P19_02960, partial [bacterium]|nr:hypothetical protein [bacterium]
MESVTQAFGKPISQFDLKTILTQIHPEVTTRKILLVGHSQGSFYVNEIYDYLITHGVPKQSIGVYAVATPASYVAGGGGYVTSTNDTVINNVRDKEVGGNTRIYADSHYTIGGVVASALRANITIPPEDGWATDARAGHAFSGVYLKGVPARIVHDINAELSKLSVPDAGDAQEGCFTPPEPTLGYKAEQAFFDVGDPLASAVKTVATPALKGLAYTVSGARSALASGSSLLQTAFSGVMQ